MNNYSSCTASNFRWEKGTIHAIASMPSLLCRSQILIGLVFRHYILTVVHTVRELQQWTKEIEWRHPSTKGSYWPKIEFLQFQLHNMKYFFQMHVFLMIKSVSLKIEPLQYKAMNCDGSTFNETGLSSRFWLIQYFYYQNNNKIIEGIS